MTTPAPKRSETDPPAANQPVNEDDSADDNRADRDSADRAGTSPDRDVEDAPGSAGRRANDPSLSGAPVPESTQVARGKPDGEVDTSR